MGPVRCFACGDGPVWRAVRHPDVVSSIAWPPFGLRVSSPWLLLRLPSDGEHMGLAGRALPDSS